VRRDCVRRLGNAHGAVRPQLAGRTLTGRKRQPRRRGSAFPRDVWAVGGADGGPPLIEHWNGSRWNVVPSPAVRRGTLADVAAVSATSVWAVGSIDTSTSTADRPPKPLVEYWNGRRWAVVPTPASTWPSGVDAVSASSAHDVWTLGDTWDHGPLVDHWDGRRWISVGGPRVKTWFLEDVAAISECDGWAVGYGMKDF